MSLLNHYKKSALHMESASHILFVLGYYRWPKLIAVLLN